MTQSHIRIPPDGTGKRLATTEFLEVGYTDLTGDLEIGDRISGAISGTLGTIIRVEPSSASTGELFILLDHGVNPVLTVGELLSAEGTPPTGLCKTTDQGVPFHTSHSVLVGGNNPSYEQHVDIHGAASVRFAEGSPLFDAFGGQKVSQPNTIGIYEFSSDGGDGLFTIETLGAATDSYNPVTSTVDLTCTGASGDSVIRTTNKCHYYWPGNGTTIVMSAALSDNGVVGNTRRLGFFDQNNGLFFEMHDTTAHVVLRSSTSGSIVDTRIPQSQWNRDRLDGTGLSGIAAQWNRATVYWIDLQWLGAGKVRFGIIGPDGNRVVVHEFYNSGQNIYPYMKSASLPVRTENFNREATGTTAQLRLTCLTVKCDGLLDYTYYRNAAQHAEKLVTTNTPLISLRAKATYMGAKNPVNIFAEEYNCFIKNGSVRLDFCWPMTLTEATWDQDFGASEVDTGATSATVDDDYLLYASYYLGPGAHNVDLRKFFEKNDEGIIANADGTAWDWNVVATAVDGTPLIQGSMTWKELR